MFYLHEALLMTEGFVNAVLKEMTHRQLLLEMKGETNRKCANLDSNDDGTYN